MKINSNHRIYEFESSIKWKKIEKSRIEFIQFPNSLTPQMKKINTHVICKSDILNDFFKMNEYDMDIVHHHDIYDIINLHFHPFDLVMIEAKIFNSIRESVKFYPGNVIILNNGNVNLSGEHSNKYSILDMSKISFQAEFNNIYEKIFESIYQFDRYNDILEYWTRNSLSDTKEEKWQNFFETYPEIIKFFIGNVDFCFGKKRFGQVLIDGTGIKEFDLVFKNNSGEAIIVELKTPSTQLMDVNKHHGVAFPVYSDVSGGINQLCIYRKLYPVQWSKEFEHQYGLKDIVHSCYLIVGNKEYRHRNKSSSEHKEQMDHFDLFRGNLKTNMKIITFDELFNHFINHFLRSCQI